MHKSISKYVRPIQVLGEMKATTYSNLAMVYWKRKQLLQALAAIQFATDLEEKLIEDNYESKRITIIQSYLNKGSIQSGLSKHDKALESFKRSLYFISIIENEQSRRTQTENEEEKTQEKEGNP